MFVLYSYANQFAFYQSKNVHLRILGFFDTYELALQHCLEAYAGQEVYICNSNHYVCLALRDKLDASQVEQKLNLYLEDRKQEEAEVHRCASEGIMRELDQLIGSQFETKDLHFIRDLSPIRPIRGQEYGLVAIIPDIDAIRERRTKSKDAYDKLRVYTNDVQIQETFQDLQERMKESLKFEIQQEPLVKFLGVSDSAEYLERKIADIRESKEFDILKHADLIVVKLYEFINLQYLEHTKAKRSSFTREQDLKQTILRSQDKIFG